MERFLPAQHIRRRADFERVYKGGSKVSGHLMTVFVGPSPAAGPRLGVAATRKLGGAVVRNHAKRLIREVFRRRRPAGDLDIIIVPRRELIDAPYPNLEREFCALVDRARTRLGSRGGTRLDQSV